MKRLFFLFFLCSQTVYALVDQGMVDNVLNMTSSDYVTRTKDEISKPVQAVNMLAHELSLYKEEARATAAAKSIIAMVLRGEGVDGLRKQSHKRRILNATEKQLATDAVKKAADYLRKQNLFDDVSKLLTPYAGEDEAVLKHDAKVRQLLGEAIDPDANKYNAIEWKRIQEEQGQEEKQEDFPVQPVTPQTIEFVKGIADQLETTLNTEKAYNLSLQLVKSLKLPDTNVAFLEGEARGQLIRALVAVEKFRMLETQQGALNDKNPRVFPYTKGSKANAASQAILVALVSAIQNYLYNPESTLEDLKRLFSYQANDHNLESIEDFLRALNPDELINQDLLDALQKPVRINDLQRIEIDQENLKQRLRYYAMPVFNQETGEITYKPTFLRFYGSSGVSNQCGFFSLGYESRQEAKDQVLDNLKDPTIFVLADRISGTSGRIRRVMDRVLNEIEDRVKAALEEEMGDILNYPFDLGEEPDERKWDSNAKEIEAEIRTRIEKDFFANHYDAESEDLLMRYGEKINFRGTYGELRRQLIDVYRVHKKRIDQEEKELGERIDAQKVDAGLPVSVPAEEEIAVWMAHHKNDDGFDMLSEAEIANKTLAERDNLQIYLDKIQAESGEKIEFKVNRYGACSLYFGEKNQLKALISPEAWSEAEDIYVKIGDQISAFSRQRRAGGIAKINSPLTSLFYSLDDFRSIIERDMVALFKKTSIDQVEESPGDDSGQLLEFPTNPDWKAETPTYPLLMGILNNYNIGAWVSKSYLSTLQSGRRGGANDEIQPIHATQDQAYSLVNELYTNKTGKQVDLTNLWGGHFEKLVGSFDYARAARSLRHKVGYSLSNTRP